MKNGKLIGPGIFVVENAFDDCEEIIYKAKNDENSIEEAKVMLGEYESTVLNFRNTKRIDISPIYSNDKFWWETAQKIWQYGNDYANHFDIFFSMMEFPQFLWYKKNEGFYNPHIDTSDTNARIFSAVLYLNDVEVGGETYFEHFDISVSPKSGRLLLFPANYIYLHGARVPESEDKHVIVTWFAP